MESSKEKMTEYLVQALNLPFREVIFAEARPQPPARPVFTNTRQNPRFIFPLTERKRIRYSDGKQVIERLFVPGEVLCCRPFAGDLEIWDTPHTMLSLVIRKYSVRVLFLSHDGVMPDPHGPDAYYHTEYPLNASGVNLLQAILTASSGILPSVLMTFRSLLQNNLELLGQIGNPLREYAHRMWENIQDYLDEHLSEELLRGNVAAHFHLHPAYLSRLAHEMEQCCYQDYLTKIRMRKAIALLDDESLAISEIANLCGYQQTSYFIRVFRMNFTDSPTVYRRKHRHAQQALPFHSDEARPDSVRPRHQHAVKP